jgi:hypothetical protein
MLRITKCTNVKRCLCFLVLNMLYFNVCHCRLILSIMSPNRRDVTRFLICCHLILDFTVTPPMLSIMTSPGTYYDVTWSLLRRQLFLTYDYHMLPSSADILRLVSLDVTRTFLRRIYMASPVPCHDVSCVFTVTSQNPFCDITESI